MRVLAIADETSIANLLAARAAVVCGPGLGLDDETRARVAAVVRRTKAPLVVDADGLNAIAGTTVLRERPGPTGSIVK